MNSWRLMIRYEKAEGGWIWGSDLISYVVGCIKCIQNEEDWYGLPLQSSTVTGVFCVISARLVKSLDDSFDY